MPFRGPSYQSVSVWTTSNTGLAGRFCSGSGFTATLIADPRAVIFSLAPAVSGQSRVTCCGALRFVTGAVVHGHQRRAAYSFGDGAQDSISSQGHSGRGI